MICARTKGLDRGMALSVPACTRATKPQRSSLWRIPFPTDITLPRDGFDQSSVEAIRKLVPEGSWSEQIRSAFAMVSFVGSAIGDGVVDVFDLDFEFHSGQSRHVGEKLWFRSAISYRGHCRRGQRHAVRGCIHELRRRTRLFSSSSIPTEPRK